MWNRSERRTPVFSIKAMDIGAHGDAEVLRAQLMAPAYREPATLEFTQNANHALVTVTKEAKITLKTRSLSSGTPTGAKWNISKRPSTGPSEASDSQVNAEGAIERLATPGEYEARWSH